MNKNRKVSSIISSVLVLFILFAFFSGLVDLRSKTESTSINEIVQKLNDNQVEKIDLKDEKMKVTLRNKDQYSTFLSKEMQDDFYNEYLKDKVEDNQLTYTYSPKEDFTIYTTIAQVLMMLVMIFLFFKLFVSKNSTQSDANNFSKSRAVLSDDNDKKIKFSDVAGLKEEKEELSEIVDFLKEPQRFTQLGARIPKGVLMIGPPGTGKTYLSRAVAGEAGVPFFTISGSDFVEMFVGVGASRVRSMFQEAKKSAPCIIFIDEIDAVGRQRGTGLGGGHDEREQTLNQLLVEMDGFSSKEGIIMIAATNRPDILDKALLRPGRFDRTVHIGIPDVKEREEMLEIHTVNKPLSEDVNLENLSKATIGFTPADLENLTNEAALLAARDKREKITANDFQNAEFKILAGPEKKSKLVIEKERVLTAFHEAGHAVCQTLLEEMDPVSIITIIPRGGAGGFTSFRPKEEKSFVSKNEMKNQIVSLLGGRASEEIFLDDISTGASNDIERATKIARDMITHYGMSERFGPVNFSEGSSMPFVGRDIQQHREVSEETLKDIDEEVVSLLDISYKKALQILNDNKDFLNEITQKLLEEETIREEEFLEISKKYKGENIWVVVHLMW